jgi:molybdate transport system ATP-binding protein
MSSLVCDLRLQRAGFTLDVQLETSAPVTGVFGPSGSGKSTLLHVIAGLLTPRAGRLVVNGNVLYDASRRIDVQPQRRRIGIVFQDNQLFPHLTIKQNLGYGLNLQPKTERRLNLEQIVELLELRDLLMQRPQQLSGGQQQRVALGRALLACPRLLLLDEPLASLDVRLKHQILPFLQRVNAELQIPMLYVSHAIDEILYLTQRLVVLDRGRVVDQGDFAELITKPAVLGLAQSLGLENVLAVEVVTHDDVLGYTLGRCYGQSIYLPLCRTTPGTIAFVIAKAASIAVARAAVTGTSIQNQLPGTISRLTPIAQRLVVEIDIGRPLLVEISLKAAHDLQLQTGDSVYCLLKAQSLSYLGSAS